MPLEIPKSPVQHPRHRASGFSIPGRLPCLLAIVLGLFAHQEALAQTTSTRLTNSGPEPAGTLEPSPFDPNVQTYTADVLFDVTQS